MARGRGRSKRSKAPVQETPEEEPEQVIEEEEEAEAELVEEGAEEEEEEANEEEEETREQLWESFKEDHYETVEQLPLYLHRTYRLIRELDERNQAHQRDIQGLLRAYLECRRRAEPVEIKPETESTRTEIQSENNEQEAKQESPSNENLINVNGSVPQDVPLDDVRQGSSGATPESKEIPSPAEARGLLTRLAVLVDEWVQNCEEKVNLAKAAYNSTDRHVCILDAAFSEQSKTSFSPGAEHDPNQALDGEEELDYVDIEGHTSATSQRPRQRNGRRRDNRKRSSASGGNRRRRGRPPITEPDPSISRKAPPVRRNGINMEVLPSEPRYCVCQQVSYGDMVMCDNEHCPIEWFHLACVGLIQAPSQKSKWYCQDCAAALGPKARRRR